MDIQDMLNLLAEKRRLTAPVTAAFEHLTAQKARYDRAIDRFNKPITIFMGLILFALFADYMSGGELEIMKINLSCLAIIAAFIALKILFAQPSKKALAEARAIYREESSQAEYIEGKKGFPQKFYNYHDTYRLYQLVNEGCAYTLPEAYNLLENQQFQEDQLYLQEETRALQEDIARSSRASAIANIVTAYNTYRN